MFLDCLILSLFSMFIVSGFILIYSHLKEKKKSDKRDTEDNNETDRTIE